MKKFLLGLLIAFAFFFTPVISIVAHAAPRVEPPKPTPSGSTGTGPSGPGSPWYNPSFFDFYDKVYNETTSPQSEIFGERYTAAQTQWVFFSVVSGVINMPYTILGLFGVEVKSPTPTVCLMSILHGTADPGMCITSVLNVFSAFLDRASAYAPPPTSVADSGTNLWAEVFSTDRPLSFIHYISGIKDNLSIVPVAHAQEGGFGLSRLLVISDMWKVTRNAAYALFVVALIAIAFMIMFRIKISPQAVVSIQSALPKIALTLILITFSLAIAGLMVDLMYVVIGLIATFLSGVSGLAGNSPIEVYNFLIGGKDALLVIGVYFILYLVIYLATAVTITISAIGTLNLTSAVFGVLMIVFSLVLFFILIVNWFKVVYLLIKNTAQIYLAVIVAPLQLMIGVFPGQLGANAFSGWLRGLAAKLAVYPVAGVLIFFSFKFLGMAFHLAIKGFTFAIVGTALGLLGAKPIEVCNTSAQLLGTALTGVCNYFYGDINISGFWGPPLLGNAGAVTGLIFLFLSVGAIMALPKVAEMIEAFLAGKSLGPSGIGEALGPFGGFVTGAQKTVTESASLEAAKRVTAWLERTNRSDRGIGALVYGALPKERKERDEPGQTPPGERH